MKSKLIFLACILALLAILATVSFPALPSGAAPPAAPTPVANTINRLPGVFFRFQPATAITADTASASVEVLNFDAVDVQYVIDQTEVNTTALTVQYSNDNSNWVNGLALVAASAADGSDLTRVPVFGRYMRINQDVTTADTITITLLAVGR